MNTFRYIRILVSMICLVFLANNSFADNDYLVVASQKVRNDKSWMKVVKKLTKIHKSDAIFYENSFAETLDKLKSIKPKYVCIVEKPESINRDFVLEVHRLSRKVDADIYGDFMWGIVTGYSAKDAMNMVKNSVDPFVIKTNLSTSSALKDSRWFDKSVWFSTASKGVWGKKESADTEVKEFRIKLWDLLDKYVEEFNKLDPDLVVSSAHATQYNLEMPFSLGNIVPKNGLLCTNRPMPKKIEETKKPRVYFPAGNCLIGDINKDRNSMALAWMKGGGATAMIGYNVPTWFGRSGWGTLKYWLSQPGALTLAEAFYLNQQDMLYHTNKINPNLIKENMKFFRDFQRGMDKAYSDYYNKYGNKLNQEEMGLLYDRDVVVYYGDPKWDVRLKNFDLGYEIHYDISDEKIVVSIETKSDFDMNKLNGLKIKQEHIGDIPFFVKLPKRLKNPGLLKSGEYEYSLSEDFLILYNCKFEPNNTYEIIIISK